MIIAVISDSHVADPVAGTDDQSLAWHRVSWQALSAAVEHVNSVIKPDITLMAGDVIDLGSGPDAVAHLTRSKAILDTLNSPVLCIPGNHDQPSATFFTVFPKLPDWTDVDGVRFVPFDDEHVADTCNSLRSDEDLGRLARARTGFDGQIVTLQHVPLFPRGSTASPFGLLNAEVIVPEMCVQGIRLAIAGHYHTGFHVSVDGVDYVCVEGLRDGVVLCTEIRLETGSVSVHPVPMPSSLK